MSSDLTFITNEGSQNLKKRFEVLIKQTDGRQTGRQTGSDTKIDITREKNTPLNPLLIEGK